MVYNDNGLRYTFGIVKSPTQARIRMVMALKQFPTYVRNQRASPNLTDSITLSMRNKRRKSRRAWLIFLDAFDVISAIFSSGTARLIPKW
jgi:hypothetical protein